MSKTQGTASPARKPSARRRASVTLTLAPESVAYLDGYARPRGLTRSAAADALLAAHAAAVRDRLPPVDDATLDLLAGLLREVGANPGLDPSRRLDALVAVGRIVRAGPGEAAGLDRAASLLAGLGPAARAALLEAAEARAAA